MKTIGYCSTLFVVILILFQLAGCGGGKDEPKEAVTEVTAPRNVPEQAAPQAVQEQQADLTKQNDAIVSQKTGPDQATETQPVESDEVSETQPAIQEIMDVIIIENQGYESDKKDPVKFSHLRHNKEYEVSCVECHHLYEDGKNLWKEGDHVDKCVVCHDPVEEKDKAIRLQSAFHKNCRDCHTEASKEGKEAPSKKCSECHGN
jgi:hypothetical protein